MALQLEVHSPVTIEKVLVITEISSGEGVHLVKIGVNGDTSTKIATACDGEGESSEVREASDFVGLKCTLEVLEERVGLGLDGPHNCSNDSIGVEVMGLATL
ncbi:hypothetical protein Ancab_007998 [Ancistrocladus abbreviatus]